MTILEFLSRCIVALVMFIVAESIYRFGRVLSEIYYYPKHYKYYDRPRVIIRYALNFIFPTKCLFVGLLAICPLVMDKSHLLPSILDYSYLIPTYILARWVGLHRGSFDAVDWIRSDSGLDYATGMASNYFHGYLNLQLPNRGDGLKGIRERMEDYEAKHNVQFAIKRLFILVPDSLHSKPKIQSELLQKVTPLEVLIKDRAGVSRPFRNDVYRFTEKIRGSTYYISVEGATPLLSFFEAMNMELTGTPEMREMQREILLKFFKSIKKYTNTWFDTKMECEIVYYNDYNAVGLPNDVGLILKNHIERMWSEGRDL